MTGSARKLLDDCFLHDRDRMRHEEVLTLLSDRLTCVAETELVPLMQATGRILAASVTAPHDVPLCDNSAVDGYAFRHRDYLANAGKLPVAARIAAGDPPREDELPPGSAVRIFTGAIMPDGFDTVAMQEDCDVSADGENVTIPSGLKQGANRRKAGEDLKAGDTVITSGHRLRPQDIAGLASIGHANALVRRPLRVALLSTGSELAEPGDRLAAGQVHDANRPMLAGILAGLPVTVTDLGSLPDDAVQLEVVVRTATASHDLILTSGGASRGEEDHMLDIMEQIGKRHLWQIAVKPGRPMMFGQGGDCVIVGLPGNPVAAMVCALLYVIPVIGHLSGANVTEPQGFQVPAGFAIARKKKDRREFLRGWIETGPDGAQRVAKFPRDGSGLVTGLREATGLIELPEETESVEPGQPVRFLPFSSFGL